MYINVKRIVEAKVPYEAWLDAGNDWTHFAHLHRKSHKEFRLLYKSGTREIFLYKSRMIYPLPFFSSFLVFRELAPEQDGYKQVYINVKSGRTHYLSASNEKLADRVRGIGDFWFDVPGYWRWMPGLFFWLFKRRMRSVAEEDNVMLRVRAKEGVYSKPACAPDVPPTFDFYQDQTKAGPPKAEFSFADSFFEDLEKGVQRPLA